MNGVVRAALLAAMLVASGCGKPAPLATPAGVAGLTAGEAGTPIGRSLLAGLDRDHDGALSPLELKDSWLEDAMNSLDTNRDGQADEREVERFFQAEGQREEARRGAPELALPVIGGVAALIGLGLAGYLTYTGLKGSHDFLYPGKNLFSKPPSAWGWAYDKVTFKSHDGLDLVGWYVPAARPTRRGIVLLHGHGSRKDEVYQKYGPMLHGQFNVFVFDQRYCGESAGAFTSLGYLEDRDAMVALQQLRERGNASIGLMGESMGAAVAMSTGAQVPDVKAVWADCGFDSLYDAVEPRVAARRYPLPGPVAHSIIKTVGLRGRIPGLEEADPIRWVAKLAPRPLYLVHGQQDDETVPANGEKLFAAAREPKTLWRTPEARHANSWELYPEEYRSRVQRFFDTAL